MDIFLSILWIILALLGIILISVILVLCLKTRISLSFCKKNSMPSQFNAEMCIFGQLVKFDLLKLSNVKKKAKKDALKAAQNSEADIAFIDKIKKYYGAFVDFKAAYSAHKMRLRRSITAEEISLSASYGTGDAASTGISAGAIWAGVYDVIAFVSRLIVITEPKVDIDLLYNDKAYSIDLRITLATRAIRLIFALISIALSFLWYQRKRKINNKKAAKTYVNTN